jgi:hypothetical protein
MGLFHGPINMQLKPATFSMWTVLLLMLGFVHPCTLDKKIEDKACLDYSSWGTIWGIMGVMFVWVMIIKTEPSLHDRLGDKIDTKHY